MLMLHATLYRIRAHAVSQRMKRPDEMSAMVREEEGGFAGQRMERLGEAREHGTGGKEGKVGMRFRYMPQ